MTGYDDRRYGFCGRCGTRYEQGAKFCGKCGNALASDFDRKDGFGRQQASDPFEQFFEREFGSVLYFLEQKNYVPYEPEENLFIRSNVEYYRKKFDEMRTLKQKVSLNWAALFFGIFWMLYRKMYGVAAAAAVVTVLAGLLGIFGGALWLVLGLGYGLFGNYLYMMTVQKRVTDVQQHYGSARSQFVEKYAGTSTTAMIIGLVVAAVGSIPFWLMIGMSLLGVLGAML